MAIYKLPKQLHPDFASPNKKPVGRVDFDPSDGLSKGLLRSYLQNRDFFDVVRNKRADKTGSLSYKGEFLSFDGSSNLMEASSTTGDLNTGVMSVYVRFKLTDATDTFFSVVNHLNGAFSNGWLVQRDQGTNDWEFRIRLSSTNHRTFSTNSTVVGEWVSLVGTFDGDTVNLYINDDPVVSNTSPSATIPDITGSLNIGTFDGSSENFTGEIDVCHVWGRALSASEARAIISSRYRIVKPETPQIYFTSAAGANTLTADSGTYTYSGTNAGLLADRILSADSGSYTYTGTAADLVKGSALTADSEAYTYSGTTVDLKRGLVLDANTGVYTYTGTAANLARGLTLSADSGSYAYTGTAATLTFASAGNFILTANTGTYTYSGTVVGLVSARILTADSGSYTYTGTAATLTRGFKLQADTAAYAYSGTAIAFSTTRILTADSGTYTYNGTNVTLTSSGASIWTIQNDAVTAWNEQADNSTTWTIQ